MRTPPPRPSMPLPVLRLTLDSRRRGMLFDMITSNSLAAFAQEAARTLPASPVRHIAAAGKAPAQQALGAAAPQGRTLEAVPPMPARPVPRGSLLDLRV